MPVIGIERRLEGIFVPTKYPKIRYLPINHPKCREDKIMSVEEAKKLLSQRVIVEEKMDGKTSMHKADKFLIFAEDLKYVHSIHYYVPARFAIFDVFDYSRTLFLCREHKKEVFEDIRKGILKVGEYSPYDFFLVELISEGKFKLEDLPRLIGISHYAYDPETKQKTYMEGIVVKPNRDLFLVELKYYAGKIVRDLKISKNYLKKKLELNIIDPKIYTF
jgi:hypothetical protein